MIRYYTAIIIFCVIVLLVNSILVFENDVIDKNIKYKFYLIHLTIFVGALSEWISVICDGKAGNIRWLLLLVRFLDYSVTPLTGINVVSVIMQKKKSGLLIHWLMIANMLLHFVSIFTGLTFTVDDQNFYHHGPLYFLYPTFYMITILYVIWAFIEYGKNYSKDHRISLFTICGFVIFGVLSQELDGGSVRTVCFSLTVGCVLIFTHYTSFVLQRNREVLSVQQHIIETDALTGLFSRYSYNEDLKKYKETQELPEDLVVFEFDVNELKAINDKFGHEAGDELIVGASECILLTFGRFGKCYRIGGDEFVTIANMSRSELIKLNESFLKLVYSWRGEFVEHMTISSGYAYASDHPGLTVEKLINVADRIMYDEKRKFYQSREHDRRSR